MGRKGESIYPQLNSEEFLVQKYLEDGIPAASIAKEVGGKCDTGAVTLALKKFGIPVRGPMGYPPKESKFPLLNDKSFLQNAYVDQRLSDKEIAIMVGASESNVIRYLKRFNIPRREGADSLRNERKFPQLHDPDWLRMMYWDNGLNLSEIAEILGVAGNGVVSLIMKELGIPTRDRSECRVYDREDDHFILDRSAIDGSLLGDGCLSVSNPNSNLCNPRFQKMNTYRDHVELVAEVIYSEGGKQRVSEVMVLNPITDQFEKRHVLVTLTHKEMRPIYDEWYPERTNRVKVIPESVVIDPVSLAHWYMDDGSSTWHNHGRSVAISFATMCFTKEDQEMLAEKINQKFDLGFFVTRGRRDCGTEWIIRISQTKNNDFYECIGLPPVVSMRYKWKNDFRSPGFVPFSLTYALPVADDDPNKYSASVLKTMGLTDSRIQTPISNDETSAGPVPSTPESSPKRKIGRKILCESTSITSFTPT